MKALQRHPLLVVALAPILAVLVSVGFNVWYAVDYIQPLLTTAQHQRLLDAVLLFNLLVFPLAGLVWGCIVGSLGAALKALQSGQPPPALQLRRARARAINLPWHFALIIATANIAVVVTCDAVVQAVGEPIYPAFTEQLIVTVVIAAVITITIAFFLIELLVQRLIFPRLFHDAAPYLSAGALPLSLPLRAFLMALAGGVGPIVMLLLLGVAADAAAQAPTNWFRLAVGLLGMAFALTGAWLFARLVVTPVRILRDAARAVGRGELDTHLDMRRADEFGVLVDEFNHMTSGLREKERLRETFGLHVGRDAAEQILNRDPGLGGQLREVTVLFCDIRDFTAVSRRQTAEQTVAWLNRFFSAMVEVVETRHGGMVNKFLGDGFMALFGAGGEQTAHAEAALHAGRDMLELLERHPQWRMQIGIGIHSGPVVVGTIGSERRLEFTAIGDAVNLASRVEALTKELHQPLLFTDATRQQAPGTPGIIDLGAHAVRGLDAPVNLYTLTQDRLEVGGAQEGDMVGGTGIEPVTPAV